MAVIWGLGYGKISCLWRFEVFFYKDLSAFEWICGIITWEGESLQDCDYYFS